MNKIILSCIISCFLLFAINLPVKAELSAREKIIQDRIKPLGQVYLDGQQPKPAVVEALGPEEIYNKYCTLCHQVGIAGAPILGNKNDWQPRISQGLETLVSHAIKGIGGMPAKGTCASCSDDDIKATVEYMVNQSS